MGIDHLIQLDCGVRHALGGKNLEMASRHLMEMMKAADRAAMIRRMAEKQGVPVDSIKVRSVKLLPTGPVEVDVTAAELSQQSAPLGRLIPMCKGCPANLLGSAFGCYDTVQYPISAAVEEWLMDRVQAPDTVGGTFLHRAIADFGYDGSAVRSYRQRKLFEAPEPPTRRWKTGFFSSKTVSADQIWHALLGVGHLAPSHASMVLIWLGALEISGRIPTRPNPDAALVQAVMAVSAEGRRKMTKLELGPKLEVAGMGAVRAFLNALYVAWLEDATLFVDA